MNCFNPICYKCLKPLIRNGLNKLGFPKYKNCKCKDKTKAS